MTGIGFADVSRYERGHILPRLGNLHLLCEVLDLNPGELVMSILTPPRRRRRNKASAAASSQ